MERIRTKESYGRHCVLFLLKKMKLRTHTIYLSAMAETSEVDEILSPRQLAKQKREFHESIADMVIYNKNSPFAPSGKREYDKIPTRLYINNKNPGSCVRKTYKLVKYECVCGESDYANCPIVSQNLTHHALSSIGRLYTVYVHCDNLEDISNAYKIFVCILCKKYIRMSIYDEIIKYCEHIRWHFPIKCLYPHDFMEPYPIRELNIFFMFYQIQKIDLQNYDEADGTRVPDTITDLYEQIYKNEPLKCRICSKYFISQSTHELLNHSSKCFNNFVKIVGRKWDEDEFIGQIIKMISFFYILP